jgi:hypothetical protein
VPDQVIFRERATLPHHTGCVLIILSFTRFVGHQETILEHSTVPKSLLKKIRPVAWLAIILQCLIGIGLALVPLLELQKFDDTFENFIGSPCIIPTVLLAFSSGKSVCGINFCEFADNPFAVIICDNFLYHWPSKVPTHHTSEISHPPVIEKSPSSEKLKCYKAEVQRPQGMVKVFGGDPVVGSLLESTHCNSEVFECPNGFSKDSKSPLIESSLSLPIYELDRRSARTGQSSVMETPLLESKLTPYERDSGEISTRAGYTRLNRDPEEGYGA